ncbi:MAG: DNA polymerase thumb domain-containing protein [Eubacteriales bacterium]
MSRVIFHSDLNCFYASVEMQLHPELRGKAIAVCGSSEDRHGIVLAKSEPAKRAGVKTGMTFSEAAGNCPGLIPVPPHFDEYVKFSRLVRGIYARYTDRIEAFGMDECWLDMTGSLRVFRKSPVELADEIRRTVREELGLTVSIGVSFCKVFAKLGSDMKKPDATTEITEEDFRRKIWGLPVGELLYVGRATTAKLNFLGVETIGDLARYPRESLLKKFGKNGGMLHDFANGRDFSRVSNVDYVRPVASIGHGITTKSDLVCSEEVWKVILELCQDVGHRLRREGLAAKGVSVSVRQNDLFSRGWQMKFPPSDLPTQSPLYLARSAFSLFRENYHWYKGIRAVTVTAISLVPADAPVQMDLLGGSMDQLRQGRLDDAVDRIRNAYGEHSIRPACLMGDLKLPDSTLHETTLPGMMNR